MCGISGFISNKPGNIDKLKILGLYNTTRGTDSCGIALNNQLVKGVGTIANFSNFIENKILETDVEHKNYTILIHTRNASQKSTKDDPECAHPFEIKNKKGKTILVGMHNGVITNETEIAKKYGVKEEKVDSKTLLSILAKAKTDDKMLKVLQDYEGAAALAWYYADEPNTLYLWKGASKQYSYGAVVEERPLFIYRVKDDTGKFTDEFYFSSIRGSLLASGGNTGYAETDVDKEPSVKTIESNCLIKIIPGEKFKVRPIKRAETTNTTKSSSCVVTPPSTKNIIVTVKPNTQKINEVLMLSGFKNYPFKKINKKPLLNSKKVVTLDNEPFIHDFHDKGNKIYFLRGRYWQNGHMIGGNEKTTYVTREVDIDGYPKDHKLCDIEGIDTYYFFQGLLLQGKEDAEAVKQLCNTNSAWTADKKELNLHTIAKHVWGFASNFKDTSGLAKDSSGGNGWASGIYYPMFDFDRKYKFDNGFFQYAEYTATSSSDKLNIIKSFETKTPVVKEEAKVIALPITTKKYSTEITEAAEAISDAEEDVIFNHCYEALSSLKAALASVEKVKTNERFRSLYSVMNTSKNAISQRVLAAENTGRKKEETIEFTTEKGPLYS